jgi:hypothetical protein
MSFSSVSSFISYHNLLISLLTYLFLFFFFSGDNRESSHADKFRKQMDTPSGGGKTEESAGADGTGGGKGSGPGRGKIDVDQLDALKNKKGLEWELYSTSSPRHLENDWAGHLEAGLARHQAEAEDGGDNGAMSELIAQHSVTPTGATINQFGHNNGVPQEGGLPLPSLQKPSSLLRVRVDSLNDRGSDRGSSHSRSRSGSGGGGGGGGGGQSVERPLKSFSPFSQKGNDLGLNRMLSLDSSSSRGSSPSNMSQGRSSSASLGRSIGSQFLNPLAVAVPSNHSPTAVSSNLPLSPSQELLNAALPVASPSPTAGSSSPSGGWNDLPVDMPLSPSQLLQHAASAAFNWVGLGLPEVNPPPAAAEATPLELSQSPEESKERTSDEDNQQKINDNGGK